jgi:hypothetical protein
MKVVKYYQVSNAQLFIMAILTGVIAAAAIVINTSVKEYLQLPIVTLTADDKCVTVSNFKNGEAYTCSDVSTILRNYRVKKN